MPPALYDTIGIGYAGLRKPDPRIQGIIHTALGDAASVLNVGAGAGSYEPDDRSVTAVELSQTMIDQRPPGAGRVVQASATALPFASGSFDAAMAVLTVHHWSDQLRGLCEMRRVSRGTVVILTWDPEHAGFWLTDYFPDLLQIDRRLFPAQAQFEQALGPVQVVNVPIPHDCTDGFMAAYWRRPQAYLDAGVRAAISTFAKMQNIEPVLAKLAKDLDSGEWEQRHGEILNCEQMDLGYRLIVAAAPPTIAGTD